MKLNNNYNNNKTTNEALENDITWETYGQVESSSIFRNAKWLVI
jgi:hypothetical protein